MIAAALSSAKANARLAKPAALALGMVSAFALHFRPWEVAFLEEWPLAEYWADRGPGAFASHYFEWSLSRPLHLVPTEIGLALTGGAPGGIFFILGLVAAAQFALMLWAIRPITRSFWLGVAVSLSIALHPLWPGGFLQRFLPAQTAALALIIAMGFLIRWLQSGRRRSIVFAAITLILGLCVYPGPAVAAPLLAVVLAVLVRAPLRRRVAAVAVTTGVSALLTTYSLVITRLIAPGSGTYEASNFTATTLAGPRAAVRFIATTLVGEGTLVIAGLLAIAALGAVLALAGCIPQWAGWLMSGTALASPLCALVFFGNASWLQDIDRVGYAIALGLIPSLMVWPTVATRNRVRLQYAIAVLLVLTSVLGGVRGVQRWQPYIDLQHKLLSEIAPVVREAKGKEVVYVVDHTGTFGSQYTLPQHYINSASHVTNQDSSKVWLCYLATDPPLDSATLCDPSTNLSWRFIKSFDVAAGDVDVYIGRDASDE